MRAVTSRPPPRGLRAATRCPRPRLTLRAMPSTVTAPYPRLRSTSNTAETTSVSMRSSRGRPRPPVPGRYRGGDLGAPYRPAALKGASRSQTRYRPGTGGLGRPRDERIDTEVVSAVLDVLRRRGYGAVTVDGIARKVKRARTSLYRRWPSKRHLVAYSVLS